MRETDIILDELLEQLPGHPAARLNALIESGFTICEALKLIKLLEGRVKPTATPAPYCPLSYIRQDKDLNNE